LPAPGGNFRFQIADFRLKTVTSDEREKQESSACGFCWEWGGWGLLIADVREANAAKDSAPSARTPGGDRRFQITDFRDARTGGDKGLADTHLAQIGGCRFQISERWQVAELKEARRA
jgi:hypothetical protein